MGGQGTESLVSAATTRLTLNPASNSYSTSRHCPACLDLDYSLYTSFESPDRNSSGASRYRYRLVEYNQVLRAADSGCPSCRIIQRAISFFWANQDLSDYDGFQPSPENGRMFRRKLCLAQQPGSSLTLFRAVVYQDTPDTSFIHALTVRDAVARIEFYREKGHDTPSRPLPYPAIGTAAHVPSAITLEHAARLASDWMSRCDASHPKCISHSSKLPRRVLDVLDGVRLVDTLVDQVQVTDTKPYMTLSHCWGSKRSADLLLKTTTRTLFERRQQVPWALVPALFQDAIRLVRALSCRYLWIDSLCIIQDDQKDWMVESASMSDIYNNAALNIAATAMRNSTYGLFKSRIHGQGFRDLQPSRASASSTGGQNAIRTFPQSQDTIIVDTTMSDQPIFARISHDRSHEVLYGDMGFLRTFTEPLFNRAWVFQERLLSRRTLHFGASELLWECRTTCFCECTRISDAHALSIRSINAKAANHTGPQDQENNRNIHRLLQPKKTLFSNVLTTGTGPGDLLSPWQSPSQQVNALLDFWLRIVEEYSFLILTKETDRSYALAGIAKRINSSLLIDLHNNKCEEEEDKGHQQQTYLAGLWAQDLPRALIWAPYRNKTVERSKNGAPSWSWMSRSCFPFGNGDAGAGADTGSLSTGTGTGGGSNASTCAVRYKHVTRNEFSADARLKISSNPADTFCLPQLGNDMFGRPDGGQISLQAASCWAWVEIAMESTSTRTCSDLSKGAKRGARKKRKWDGKKALQLVLDPGSKGVDSRSLQQPPRTRGGRGRERDDGDACIPFEPDCPGRDPKTVALSERVLCVLFGRRKLVEAEGEVAAPHYLLALAPVEGRDGVYTRVGFCETEGRVELFETSAEVRSVRIV